MQLIKLDGRHRLYKQGFKYAFVFTDYSPDQPNQFMVEQLVKNAEGYGWSFFNTAYGKRKPAGERRPFYVGFKNESTATIVQLQI